MKSSTNVPLLSLEPVRLLQICTKALEPTEKNLSDRNEYLKAILLRVNLYERDYQTVEKRMEKLKAATNKIELKELQKNKDSLQSQLTALKQLSSALWKASSVKEEEKRQQEISQALRTACTDGCIDMQRYYAIDFIRNIAGEPTHILDNDRSITQLTIGHSHHTGAFFTPASIDYLPQLAAALHHNISITRITLWLPSDIKEFESAVLSTITPALSSDDQLKKLEQVCLVGDLGVAEAEQEGKEEIPTMSFSSLLPLATALKDRHLSQLILQGYKGEKDDSSFLDNLKGTGTITRLDLIRFDGKTSSLGRFIKYSQVEQVNFEAADLEYSTDLAYAFHGLVSCTIVSCFFEEEALAIALATSPSLLSLTVADSPFSRAVIKVFSRFVPKALTSLQLDLEDIPREDIKLFTTILKSENCALTQLHLNDSVDNDIAVTLAENLKQNTQIRILQVFCDRIGVEALATYHNSLADLYTRAMFIGDNAIGVLDKLQQSRRDLYFRWGWANTHPHQVAVIALRQSWMEAALLIAFIRSNQMNTLRTSIITLLPGIIAATSISAISNKKIIINPSRLMDSRFFHNRTGAPEIIPMEPQEKHGQKRKQMQ